MLSDKALQKYADPFILGQGTLGTTYLARRLSDDQQVVVKEIDLGMFCAEDADAIRVELAVLQRAESNYIVNVYDVIYDEALTHLYCEMEYCPGKSLGDLIKYHRKTGEHVSEAFVWETLAQLVHALQDLHALYAKEGRRILTRLRTSGILFTGSGRLKISDPSIYSPNQGFSAPLKLNASLPPELQGGKRAKRAVDGDKHFTEKADMWSLGCVFLELCTLQPPATPVESVEGIIDCQMGSYSDDLKIILRMCLRIAPAERISSANLCLLPQIKQVLQRLKLNASSSVVSWSPGTFRANSRSTRYHVVDGDTDLMLAAASGVAPAVQQHIGQAKATNSQKQTALMLAAMYGHSDCVALLLDLEHGMFDVAGKTALMYAAENSRVGCVGLLKDAEGGLSSSMGQTALMLAAATGSEVCVHLLLSIENGLKDVAGMTALMHSIVHEKLSCVEILAICESRNTNLDGETALMCAIRYGNYDCVAKLAELEAGVVNADGKSAVVLAVEQRFLKAFTLMLEYEALTEEECSLLLKYVTKEEDEAFYLALETHARKYSISLGSSLQPPRSVCTAKTELMVAAEAGDAQRVARYIEQCGQITTDGWTALMLAAYHNHSECCRLLLKEANIGVKGRPTALAHAMARNSDACIDLLYPMEKYSSKITSLMWHAYKGESEAVTRHLKDVRKQSGTGMTALMYAAQQGNIACVQGLVDYELKMRTKAGWTALMYAAEFGNAACIWLLIGETRLETRDGRTALMLATINGHTSCLDRLCQYEHRLRGRQGWTALMHAASKNNVDAVKLLATHEAGIQDKKGQTALMIATARDHIECVELLLSEAQLVTYKPLAFPGHIASSSDTKGTTALLIAMRRGLSGVARLLGRIEQSCTFVTPLMVAASTGNVEQVKSNLNQAGLADESGATALMYATVAGNVSCVELLVDIESGHETSLGDTALMLALKNNQLQCLAFLIDSEEHVYASSKQSLMHSAVMLDSPVCFTALIDYFLERGRLNVREVISALIDAGKTSHMNILGASARKYGRSICREPLQCRKRVVQETELMQAARIGNVKMAIRHLSQLGCLCKGGLLSNGGTALQWAVDAGHAEVARLLLAEVGILSDDGYSALLRACEKGNRELVSLLMPYELDLAGVTQLIANASIGNCNACAHVLESTVGTQLLCRATDMGHTALMLAARHGHDECVSLLCTKEAGLLTPKGITALMEAAVNNHVECVKLLAAEECGLQNGESFSAMMLAASLGHEAVVRELAPKEHGMQTSTGTTALMFAAVSGHTECIKHLVSHEACVQNDLGWTALMYAASKGHADCLPLLFAETSLRNKSSQFALDIALLYNKYECFEVLQGREARIRGMTDLMLATIRDNIDDVCAFVHLQANCKDVEQRTALMYACKFGHTKCVEILAEHEAGAVDSHGHTALMHAIEWGHMDCVRAVVEREISVKREGGPGPIDIAVSKASTDMLTFINGYMDTISGST